MKYLLLGGESRGDFENISPEEQTRRIQQHQASLNALLRERVIAGRRGLIFASVGLGLSHAGNGGTVTIRNRRGRKTRTDGPFAETREVIGGFDIIDFDTREEAIGLAKDRHQHETHVSEVRPIKEFWWISHSPALTTRKIFMLSSFEDEQATLSRPDDERKKIMRQHQSVGAEYVTRCGMVEGAPGLWIGVRLAPSSEAVTIRLPGGKVRLHDGPFAETKEVMGGFNLIACNSLEEASEWAEKLAACEGDTIEIRPVNGFWWVYHE